MTGRILIVDDDQTMCEYLDQALVRRGFSCSFRTSGEAALELVAIQDVDVVVTDLNMRGMSGTQLCERLVANRPDLPVVVITAFGSLETAVAAIRAGAYDFVTKPFEIESLVLTLQRAVQHRALRDEVKRLQRVVADAEGFGSILGKSPAMMKVYELLSRVADSDSTVLITGETGTGKELVARALHQKSLRRTGAFVPINCTALPEPLLESELFGHVKGAFTDAKATHPGLFLRAHGGTLFLDEVGDLPVGLQPKLLRALEERAVRPVGAEVEQSFDARLIAATNRDLEYAVEERRFREDLFFRLNVIHIELPPLRARGGDVLLLAQHFIEQFAQKSRREVTGLSSPTAEKLLAYSWPGNVRELRNCIERAVAVTQFSALSVDDLPEKIKNYKTSHVVVASSDPTELVPMEEVERRYILRVLEAVGGNKSMAAQVLGFDRKTLYRKLERYERATPTGKE